MCVCVCLGVNLNTFKKELRIDFFNHKYLPYVCVVVSNVEAVGIGV